MFTTSLSIRRASTLTVLGGAAVLLTGFLPCPVRAQNTIAQKVADPAYFVPNPTSGPSFWSQLDQSTPYVGIAVANVINGPDYLASSDYVNAISAANAAGIKVLGYVRTGYFGSTGLTTRLRRSDTASWLAQIEQDVNAWYNLYGSSGLAGIFFDEAQNSCSSGTGSANLYSFITAYVKQNHTGALVAENPGTAVDSCFQGTADILLTFEGTYLCYIQDSSCPAGQQYTDLSWNPVDPKSIWHLIYNASSGQFANASALTKTRGAGWVYITSDTLPNPWDSLPSGSDWSGELADTAPAGGDTTPPSTPAGLTPSSVGYTSVVLNWGASTDSGSGVVGYDIFQNGVWIVSSPAAGTSTQSVTVTGLLPNSSYTFAVQARDGSGNVSSLSNSASLTTLQANGAPPTAPGNLSVQAVTYSSVTLSWNASSDSLGISAYDVYQGGSKILTVNRSTTSTLVGGILPATQSTFTVKARDSQGNTSASSNTVSPTTLALPPQGAISDPSLSYNGNSLKYSANFYLAYGFDHVFIDSDNNQGTGWQTASNPSIGADYLIENNTLYQYAGTGTDWTWTIVDNSMAPRVKGYNLSWRVPTSEITNLGQTQSVVFGGNGFAPTAYSTVLVGQ